MARRAYLSRTHDERDELERGEHNLITTWSAALACWWTAPRGLPRQRRLPMTSYLA